MPHWRRYTSATARLAALIFILQICVAATVLLYARNAITQQSTRDQQAFVIELQQDMLAAHGRGGNAGLAREISRRLTTLRGENVLLLLTDANSRFVAGNLDAWPTVVPKSIEWRTIDLFRSGSDRVERFGVSTLTLPDGGQLLTGKVIDTALRVAGISEQVLLVAFLLAIPLALLVAFAMTRVIERRIAGIAATAIAVGAGDLAQRVPSDGTGDVFDRLGTGVNAMLGRVEVLVGELRVVTDSLAHDLRAPIFRITTTLEQAMQETDDVVAVAAMDRVAVETDVLQQMLSTAMQIAQAEAGVGRNRFIEVDVAEMLTGLAELYECSADDQGLSLHVDVDAGGFRLHRELIGQALSNLINNALKYAAGATTIALSATRNAEGLELTVTDDGVGIAPDDREIALRRFGRIDPSRHQSGAGLGLSLVEAVARLHGGGITLSDNNPGLRVILRLQSPA